MKKLLFATGNRGKLAELTKLLEGLVEVVSVKDLPIDAEVVEDGETFEANARKKASVLAMRSGLYALSDDSGLEVDALDGAPGVYSARYAGEGASDADNVTKLLAALSETSGPRTARFRCVLAFAHPSGEVLYTTDGTCEGTITESVRGTGGFGYDPVFVPEGESRTMAELSPDEKNARSHRGAATRTFRSFLDGFLVRPLP